MDYTQAGAGTKSVRIYVLLSISIIFFLAARIFPGRGLNFLKKEMVEASQLMAQAADILRACREAKGIPIDRTCDINATGLIGKEFSSVTTSVGQLEAKRTSSDPNFAGLLVYLLRKAGVRNGDVIAVGASGSFPALITAVLAASKAMEIKPLIICSIGASQWGANNPDFHVLDMQRCLAEQGIFSTLPIAYSLGGIRDIGEDMSEPGREKLTQEIRKSGVLFLSEPDLGKNVAKRMKLYIKGAELSPIKAFVNIGGSWVNMGTDSRILEVKPGLAHIDDFPPVEKQGMIFAMAAKNVPVIHCLFVKGLVRKYGLEWDPSPLPKPGESRLYSLVAGDQKVFLLIAAGYFVCILFLAYFIRNKPELFIKFDDT